MFAEAWKLTIITERVLEQSISKFLLDQGCKGYTLFSVGGKGLHHFHAPVERGVVPEEFSEIQFEVIVKDRTIIDKIASALVKDCFPHYAGIVFIEKVEVIRVERF
jgi:nitrogen regulatory protein PII